ncbi:hypothetical protein KY290_036781 [Solanum tuberosum]|uniref:Retroviral polymerase SH3-like domain-containing protein n=1 Tax=Solanum tuberosum TaxID=4113 RepID=A0ABQ7TVD2_SOLTU|nr:hypothetical protein KY290_036781 [Solanum tuberosum]
MEKVQHTTTKTKQVASKEITLVVSIAARSDTHLSSVGEGVKLSADVDARVVNEQEEDQLFVASCFASNVSSESWLIDSGCTNHITNDKELFKELKPTRVANVRIGHCGHIPVKGMGTIAIETQEGTKTIPDVKRDKLDKKAIIGIHMGYSGVSKAYKVYHPQTEKMTITRDVHFSKNEQWDWKNSQK